MSRTTKRKHVLKEQLEEEYALPAPAQRVVRLLASKGNNLHEVAPPSGEPYLVSMPTKFRKNIWVKRGDFVLVEPILEGDKVKAEIVKILNADIIKYFKDNNVWPAEFDKKKDEQKESGDMFVNTNRVTVEQYSESDSSDSHDSREEQPAQDGNT